MENNDTIDFDLGDLDWVKIIEKESRKYAINSDAHLLANYIVTWNKYAPKDEKIDIKVDLDFMYETLFGGYYEYNDEEIEKLKKRTSIILKSKPKLKIKYKLLRSLVKDNHYTWSDIASKMNYSLKELLSIINNNQDLSYKDSILLSSIFSLTPDDVFYSEFKKQMKKK